MASHMQSFRDYTTAGGKGGRDPDMGFRAMAGMAMRFDRPGNRPAGAARVWASMIAGRIVASSC